MSVSTCRPTRSAWLSLHFLAGSEAVCLVCIADMCGMVGWPRSGLTCAPALQGLQPRAWPRSVFPVVLCSRRWCPRGMCRTISFGALPRGRLGGAGAFSVEAGLMLPCHRPNRVSGRSEWWQFRPYAPRVARFVGVLWWLVLYRSSHDDLHVRGKGGVPWWWPPVS